MDRKIEQKKGLKPKHIGIAVGVISVIGLVLFSIFGNHLSVFKVDKDKLTISSVDHDVFKDYISLNGTVEPISTIYVNSKERGSIAEKHVENGMIVKAGDTLIRLTNPELLLEIQNAKATFAEQQNAYNKQRVEINKRKIELTQQRMASDLDVKQMKREYEQKEAMYNDGMCAKEDYLRAKENYEMQLKRKHFLIESQAQDSIYQTTQLKQLNESMAINQLNLNEKQKRADDLIVRASITGQLGDFNMEIGQTINDNQSIGTISVLTDHKITALIDEHYIDRVRRDLKGDIERNADNYHLYINRVYPEVKDGQFKVDFVFETSKPDNIRTGQSYYVKLQLGSADEAIMIPRGSFFQSTGGQWIFVLDGTGNYALKRPIKIGKQNPQYYEILDGLNPGEKVITSSYDTFGDAEKIVFK